MSAAYQPISLLINYGGSRRTFSFLNHGWLAVDSIPILGCILEPSVPRFNPRVMTSKTGGGYRRYPHLCSVTFLLC
ncbi:MULTISPECIES: hypothetical protein [Limnospira]|uniref:Uncharacterized protein n=1 Tax=Limnospira fusiformis PMC 851.14 TaxID=2219512 RepID=A0ABU9EKB4_LIMFS|nr:hypothetical protein [Limnospira maxima]QJB26510.1 hypothetical protein HFV01_12730 [Limnospira fusiformis SAG 85.79]RAQ49138.1 hypothetical protein B9S53_00655 [Arthrospira sp. O9.13F]